MSESLARRIGRNIAALRLAKDWSQEVLAARVGLTRSRLSKWESGDHVPPVEKLVDLARELEVGLDDLVGDGTERLKTSLSPEQRRLVRAAMGSLARLFPAASRKPARTE
ncbi:MAG TPA: helix-turn-helix transcriptional regulator [Thermoanaerobaculia bacterium]|jgi:transcriptional regulator with XRE-family HTH domain|nr:helix-turn-helix transcriptional regulator [Thermoanaerobaculia bacterium]